MSAKIKVDITEEKANFFSSIFKTIVGEYDLTRGGIKFLKNLVVTGIALASAYALYDPKYLFLVPILLNLLDFIKHRRPKE